VPLAIVECTLAAMRAYSRTRGVRAVGRNLRWAGAIVAVLALVTAPAAWASTHDQRVDPFAAGWTATGNDTGYCSTGAESTKRSDAYRCFRGSYAIEDPCFAAPGNTGTVRCPYAPWSRKTFEVQLTKPLPVLAQGPAMVWAVVLANGGRCTSTEALDKSFGHAIAWTCTNGELAQGLHSEKTWWALWQPSNGAPWKHISIRTLFR
jgi:hypothetical protein